jgi:hypothetical protein
MYMYMYTHTYKYRTCEAKTLATQVKDEGAEQFEIHTDGSLIFDVDTSLGEE